MVGRSKAPQSRPRCLRVWSAGALLTVVLAGCGGSGGASSASTKRSSALETAAARERAQHERERPAEEEKKARAEAIMKQIGPCERVDRALASMTGAIGAATKPGASSETYEQASSEVETLRGKLTYMSSRYVSSRRAWQAGVVVVVRGAGRNGRRRTGRGPGGLRHPLRRDGSVGR